MIRDLKRRLAAFAKRAGAAQAVKSPVLTSGAKRARLAWLLLKLKLGREPTLAELGTPEVGGIQEILCWAADVKAFEAGAEFCRRRGDNVGAARMLNAAASVARAANRSPRTEEAQEAPAP